MKKGTQAMLDAAKDDATLLPYGVKFKTNGKKVGYADQAPVGIFVNRIAGKPCDDVESVAFGNKDGSDWWYCSSATLEPIKKAKKWQNGTQAQLDAAKDDARLIPKKTYFKSKLHQTLGKRVYKIDYVCNDSYSVLMIDDEEYGKSWCYDANELEPIND